MRTAAKGKDVIVDLQSSYVKWILPGPWVTLQVASVVIMRLSQRTSFSSDDIVFLASTQSRGFMVVWTETESYVSGMKSLASF